MKARMLTISQKKKHENRKFSQIATNLCTRRRPFCKIFPHYDANLRRILYVDTLLFAFALYLDLSPWICQTQQLFKMWNGEKLKRWQRWKREKVKSWSGEEVQKWNNTPEHHTTLPNTPPHPQPNVVHVDMVKAKERPWRSIDAAGQGRRAGAVGATHNASAQVVPVTETARFSSGPCPCGIWYGGSALQIRKQNHPISNQPLARSFILEFFFS